MCAHTQTPRKRVQDMKQSQAKNPLALPLPVYLSTATTNYASSKAAWQLWKSGLLHWNPALKSQAAALLKPPSVNNLRADAAFEDTAHTRLIHFLEGIKFYLETPAPEVPRLPRACLWQEGSTQLLDYGSVRARKADKPAILFIPSLINKSYILDLMPDRSLLQYLSDEGFHPLLLDWNEPSVAETSFTLEDYITQRVEPALEEAQRLLGRKVVLAGYCMGGLLAMAAALRKKQHVQGLVLLATPWDFQASDVSRIALGSSAIHTLENLLMQAPLLPAATVHALFYFMNPFAVHRKFERLYALSEHEECPVLLARERWVNDGIPLTREVARTCFIDWAANNTLVEGEWNVDGTTINPAALRTPTFIALPKYDQIVPPACATPLAKKVKGARTVSCPSGHVGMIVGRSARESLWLPLAKWLQSL
jgi:polyhydroxyalkanoate synthase